MDTVGFGDFPPGRLFLRVCPGSVNRAPLVGRHRHLDGDQHACVMCVTAWRTAQTIGFWAARIVAQGSGRAAWEGPASLSTGAGSIIGGRWSVVPSKSCSPPRWLPPARL